MGLLAELFPVPPLETADKFAARRLAENELVQNIKITEEAIGKIVCVDVAQEIVLHSRRNIEMEEQRQSSIMGRAQGLFFVAALLSFFLTFGASLLSARFERSSVELYVTILVCVVIVFEIMIMLINVLSAVSGISYSRTSSTNLRDWSKIESKLAFYRTETVHNLRLFRDASLKNTWRFERLHGALRSLRNAIFCVCVLIASFFVFAIFNSTEFKCENHVLASARGKAVYEAMTGCNE